MKTKIFLLSTAFISAACLVAVIVVSCGQGNSNATDDSTNAPKPADFVLAKVGDRTITLEDVLYFPDLYGTLGQNIIKREVMLQEAAKRGVTVSQVEIADTLDKNISSQGGWEQLFKTVPDFIPKSVVVYYFRNMTTVNLYQSAILKDEFKKQHGEITFEELQEKWNANMKSLQQQYAYEHKEVAADDVTMDLVRDILENQIEQDWQGKNGQTFLDDLTKSYAVENYLKDMAPPYPEDIKIPEILKEDKSSEETPPAQDNQTEGESTDSNPPAGGGE